MKKIKKVKKQQQKKPLSLRTKIILSAIIGILAVAIVILISIENSKGKMVINNNTELQLEYIKAYFVDGEGPINDAITINELEPGKKIENAMERINLYAKGANLEVRFKFAGNDELLVDAGIFNDVFDGRITINFTQEKEDDILLAIKASNGLLPSTLIQCDEIYEIKDGYIDE